MFIPISSCCSFNYMTLAQCLGNGNLPVIPLQDEYPICTPESRLKASMSALHLRHSTEGKPGLLYQKKLPVAINANILDYRINMLSWKQWFFKNGIILKKDTTVLFCPEQPSTNLSPTLVKFHIIKYTWNKVRYS